MFRQKPQILALFVAVLLVAATILPVTGHSQTTAEPEKEKIEALIKRVSELQDAKFVRNGAEYDVTAAIRFLRGKWRANDKEVNTARDFIDKVASSSGTSGKPYLIRFKDGREIPSREFLLAELKKQDT